MNKETLMRERITLVQLYKVLVIEYHNEASICQFEDLLWVKWIKHSELVKLNDILFWWTINVNKVLVFIYYILSINVVIVIVAIIIIIITDDYDDVFNSDPLPAKDFGRKHSYTVFII